MPYMMTLFSVVVIRPLMYMYGLFEGLVLQIYKLITGKVIKAINRTGQSPCPAIIHIENMRTEYGFVI